MQPIERRYHASRGNRSDNHEYIDVVQEESAQRNYVRFTLMEQRWRSKAEAASYLRWAADQLETLP